MIGVLAFVKITGAPMRARRCSAKLTEPGWFVASFRSKVGGANGQVTLIAAERFEERGEPRVGREAFEKLAVAGGFAQHVRSRTVRGVAAVARAFRISEVDCADLIGSVVAAIRFGAGLDAMRRPVGRFAQAETKTQQRRYMLLASTPRKDDCSVRLHR